MPAAVHPRRRWQPWAIDMEKIRASGPGTHEHCYRGRLALRFSLPLWKENSDWLEVSTPGAYLESHAPLGRADLPTASYTEMMEWALPERVSGRRLSRGAERSSAARPRNSFLPSRRFPGAAIFFASIPNPTCCTKKMLRVSRRAIAAAPVHRDGAKSSDELLQARDLLLRAQCNDAYWHGIFGGIYAPHLRTDPWRNLNSRRGYRLTGKTPGALRAACSNFWTTTPTAPTSCSSPLSKLRPLVEAQ